MLRGCLDKFPFVAPSGGKGRCVLYLANPAVFSYNESGREVKRLRTGQEIQRLRTAAGLTQEQLAERLYVSRELISKWELGQRKPDIRMLREMAALFSVGVDRLADTGAFAEELAACLPPGAPMDAARFRRVLPAFLETLSDRDRGVFLHRYYFLESASEIAALFDVKENFVRAVLARTRRKLKKYLKEEWK